MTGLVSHSRTPSNVIKRPRTQTNSLGIGKNTKYIIHLRHTHIYVYYCMNQFLKTLKGAYTLRFQARISTENNLFTARQPLKTVTYLLPAKSGRIIFFKKRKRKKTNIVNRFVVFSASLVALPSRPRFSHCARIRDIQLFIFLHHTIDDQHFTLNSFNK